MKLKNAGLVINSLINEDFTTKTTSINKHTPPILNLHKKKLKKLISSFKIFKKPEGSALAPEQF